MADPENVHPLRPATSLIDRLAADLDAQHYTLGEVRDAWPGWALWWSELSGCYHARRDNPSGRWTDHGDGRRFHVAAMTIGRLIILLMHQADLDAEQESAAISGPYSNRRGDRHSPGSR